MKIFKIVLCVVISTFLLASCTKEDMTGKRIVGNWDVVLYSQNGLDILGSDIVAVEIEFQEYNTNFGKGDFVWVTEAFGERRVVTGQYFLNADETQLNFDNTDEENFFFEFDIDLGASNLELETSLSGDDYLIQAEKR